MSEEKRAAFNEFYQRWQNDPSQVMVEEALDHLLFYVKSENQTSIAHGRRFEMSDERFNGLEERISSLTTEIARWREEIRLMRERINSEL